jgi:outer membrane protein assembly factor BamB
MELGICFIRNLFTKGIWGKIGRNGKMRLKNSAFVAIFLTTILVAAAFMIFQEPASAQTTSTPENWIKLVTQTPEGAYRQISGQTTYPWLCSPGGNSERTGYSNGPGPATNHTLWRKELPIHNWAFGTVDKGAVYTISMDQNALYAIDAYTGETIWQYDLPLPYANDTGNQILGPWNNDNYVHLVGNLVFAGYGDMRKTMAVGMVSGNLEWLSPEAARVSLICPPGTVFEDSYAVYLTTHNTDPIVTTCYKFTYDEQTRIEKIWETPNVAERISYYDGKVYGAPDASRWVSCASATTGNLIWNWTLPDTLGEYDVSYQHPVIAEGRAYFPLESNRVEVLDANNGHFLWEYVTDGDYVENVAVHNGKLYVTGGSEAKLYCMDAASSNKLWEYQATGPLDYYNPIIAQDKVYFSAAAEQYEGFPLAGTYAGYMHCIDANTGTLIWKYLSPETCVNIWVADGNLYSPTPFHQLWCWGAGPTTTTLSADGQGAVLLSGSVTDMSPFSQQHPELQSPTVSGVPIVLSYVKDGAWTDFATVNTASDGKFMFSWTPPSSGAFSVVARFEGNDAYYWSSAQATFQTGSSAQNSANSNAGIPVEYFVIAVVAISAIAIIVVAIVLKKRK